MDVTIVRCTVETHTEYLGQDGNVVMQEGDITPNIERSEALTRVVAWCDTRRAQGFRIHRAADWTYARINEVGVRAHIRIEAQD